jgi:hypothetical protein
MASSSSLNMVDLGPLTSLALQAFTAYMVVQLVRQQTNTSVEASKTEGEADEAPSKSRAVTVVANKEESTDERSIRAENVYGPYKKASRQYITRYRSTGRVPPNVHISHLLFLLLLFLLIQSSCYFLRIL